MKINLGGIVKKEQVEFLSAGLNLCYKFDLRPQSFYFTQINNIVEMTESLSLADFYLCFGNDNELTIEETLKRIPRAKIEFYLFQNTEFHEQFEREYSLHIKEDFDFNKLLEMPNCKSLIVKCKDLSQLASFNRLHPFMSKLISCGVEYSLFLDWDELPELSWGEFYSFTSISLDFNQKVEISYQNPDLNIVLEHLKYLKAQL